LTPTFTQTLTPSPSFTAIPTLTRTRTPTPTRTRTFTLTPTPSRTHTRTQTRTPSRTPIAPTATRTRTPLPLKATKFKVEVLAVAQPVIGTDPSRSRATLRVTALDDRSGQDRIVTDYDREVAIDSTDFGMERPRPTSFTALDRGVKTFANGLRFRRGGLVLVRVFEIQNSGIQSEDSIHVAYDPDELNPAHQVFFVAPGGADDGQHDGSRDKPWRQLHYAVRQSAVRNGATIHVRVEVDPSGREEPVQYEGGVVLDKRVTVL